MSQVRWLVSALIIYHLIAVSSHALPPPGAPYPRSEPASFPAGWRSLSRLLTPLLDGAAVVASGVEGALFSLTEPLRAVTQPYISTGLRQFWAMFANPKHQAEYMRLDYHVERAGGRNEIVRELIYPVGRTDRVRVTTQFLDKAVQAAYESQDKSSPSSSATARNGADLVPMVRFFRSRFEARALEAGQRVTRVDVWYGLAPLPSPGERYDPTLREQVLERYYSGPFIVDAQVSQGQDSKENEGDIVWSRIFLDTP